MSHPPFVYVCSVIRTGSTVIADFLTEFPHCFIFREPRVARGQFTFNRHDRELLHEHIPELRDLIRSWRKAGVKTSLEVFFEELVPLVLENFTQVGIKEIYHSHWKDLLKKTSEVRAVITARDPRDIYLSLIEMREHYKSPDWRWHNLSLQEMASIVKTEFEHQREVIDNIDSIIVRYENLCTDTSIVDQVREHVHSVSRGLGNIGDFVYRNPYRRYEADRHGRTITSASVSRWRNVTDQNLIQKAESFRDLLPDYCSFFGY